MDIITHGVVGALVAQSLSSARNIRVAALVGFIAALLPDLDVLIQRADDPLLVLEYHRHLTHSLFFAPVAALTATILCAPLVRGDFSRPHLYTLILSAYASACLLDICTSYGTYWLWPLVNEPLALGIIAVVDPVFTGLLLIAMIAAWFGRRRTRAWIGLAIALGYLTLGWIQHQRAEAAAMAWVADQGLSAASVQVKPTMGNLLLWGSLTVTADHQVRADGIRAGAGMRVYPGEQRQLVDLARLLQGLPAESRAYRELLRYQQINQPLLVTHSEDEWMIGDARYAMLPTFADPLWGLRINPHQPNAVPEFVTHRKLTPEMRKLFIAMLLGRPSAEGAADAQSLANP